MTALRLPSLLIAALLAAAAAGCGGGSDRDPRQVLAQAFGAGTAPIRTAHLDVRLDVGGRGVAGLPAPLSLHLDGAVGGRHRGALPKFDLRLALRTARGRTALGAISVGDRAWLVLHERAYTLSDGDVRRLAAARPAATAAAGHGGRDGALGALGVSPGAWLRDPRTVGTETLDGQRVDHVAAGVDVPRMLADVDRLLARGGRLGTAAGADVPTALPAKVRRALARQVRDARVDVWAGRDDHLLRRLALTVRSVAEAGAPDAGRPGTLRLVVGLSGLNRPQPIGPPAGARPLGELTAGLRAVATRLRREQAAGAGAGSDAYERCLADAGGDLVLAQRCAALVGG